MPVCSIERRISPIRANSVTLLIPRPNFSSGPAQPVAKRPTTAVAMPELINLRILVFPEVIAGAKVVKAICLQSCLNSALNPSSLRRGNEPLKNQSGREKKRKNQADHKVPARQGQQVHQY